MIEVCDSFANLHFIEFNLIKSKLLCFNCDTLNVPIFFNGKRILVHVVSHDKHLSNFISADILGSNMIDYVSDFYQRSNWVISDFRARGSNTLDGLHTCRTSCLHVYGYKLGNLTSDYVAKSETPNLESAI